MISKDNLKEYARKLMFEMNDSEYQTLEEEFGIILKQMELIEKIEGISDYEPMTFPFINSDATLREDVASSSLTVDEVLANAKSISNNRVKVPKVVE